ncbi:hypothetical protein [Nocardia acidivorans]|uniref:hypothetical protein n=1 Tax=Nocardia acidivorans TaxID=404580 RepID=UPI0012FAFA2D|nr:hypothetical protein [Nocardia acidivorans]
MLSRRGDGDLSTGLFDAALSAARRAGNTRYESMVHARAAIAHLIAGRLASAADAAERAETTRDSARTGAVAHTYNMLIRYTALKGLGRNDDAAECHRIARSRIADFDAALIRFDLRVDALRNPRPGKPADPASPITAQSARYSGRRSAPVAVAGTAGAVGATGVTRR